jgi:hypothetical protein
MPNTRIALLALIACGCAGSPPTRPSSLAGAGGAASVGADAGTAEPPFDEGGVSPEYPDAGPLAAGSVTMTPRLQKPPPRPALPPVTNDGKISLPEDAVVIWDRERDAKVPHGVTVDQFSNLRVEQVALRPGVLYLVLSNHIRNERPYRGWYKGTTLTPTVELRCSPGNRKISPRVTGAVEIGGVGPAILAIGRAQLPKCEMGLSIRVFDNDAGITLVNSGKGLTVPKHEF